jgi:adenylate kinase family enzyme
MQTRRIHVMGASGAGVTTLGRALADDLAVPHHDTDDYYWLPTTPPYQTTRPVADRLRLMQEIFIGRAEWVLSGSLDSWGAPIMPLCDLIVFVRTPAAVRLQRLRAREVRRYGAAAIEPGGWRHAEAAEFLEWAAHYDDGSREGRHLARHQAWLKTAQCRVLCVDGTNPVSDLVAQVTATVGI